MWFGDGYLMFGWAGWNVQIEVGCESIVGSGSVNVTGKTFSALRGRRLHQSESLMIVLATLEILVMYACRSSRPA
jgi:hypothetical protein